MTSYGCNDLANSLIPLYQFRRKPQLGREVPSPDPISRRSVSFHPYSNQVRYYLATADHLAAHLCRPHRYGPFVRCFLARPLWSVFPLFARSPSRMRRRILFREGRSLSAACSLFGLAASPCCGSRLQDDPKGFSPK